jgi:ABC-2 type transport system ATP-binding protein
MTAIVVEDLRKSYGPIHAVAGVSFSVEEGECVALLGPNGAGKTTTLEVLEGYLECDSGTVRVLGADPYQADRRWREQVGIVLQSTGIDPYLTVAETVEMYRGYYPSPRPLDEVIDLVGLEEKRDARVVKLSGGQQRRLDVAVALAGDPELLFLDEPTTGFDPSARRNAWEIVKNLAALGKTVFLTTHYMDEAQYLAGRVAVISSGVIVAEGPPSRLGGRDTATAVVRFRLSSPNVSLPEAMASGVTREDGGFRYQAADPTRFLHDLTGWAIQNGVTLEGLDVSRPTLEDIYLKLTAGDAETPEPAEVSS